MKKTICVICSLLSLCLSSCSTGSTSYKTQSGIEFNYNNISAYNDFWITNDNICFLEDSLFQNYFLANENGKKRIDSNQGYGFGKIQQYGKKIYMLDQHNVIDESNSDYQLKCYDVESKKTTGLITIRNCDNFLILDENVVYLEYDWSTDSRTLALKLFSVNSNSYKTINNSVLSFGVIGKTLYYVTEEENVIAIFQYDIEMNSSAKCGEFVLKVADVESFREGVIVSYTPNYVILSWSDYQNNAATIWKFAFEEKNVNTIEVNGCISKFISFDKCSYFAMVDCREESVTKILKMTNDTNEMLQIGQIAGDCSLFVGSDKGVYVLEYDKSILIYYTEQNTSEIVYKF